MATRIHIALAIGLAAAACGDVSNEDLLFDSALPDKTVEFVPPQQNGTTSQALGDGWVLETGIALTAAGRLNLFSDEVVTHVATFTARSPDVRGSGHREWAAVRIAATGLFARLTMNAVSDVTCDVSAAPLAADAPQYRWTIEVSAQEDSGFVAVMTGESRGVEFGHSCGDMSVNVAAARSAGIVFADTSVDPVTTFAESWQRDGDQSLLTSHVSTDGTANSYLDDTATYLLQTTPTDGGLFQCALSDDVRGDGIEHLLMVLQWDSGGRPWRADFCIDATGGTCGTACGPDPLDRTYLTDSAKGTIEGTPAVCGNLAYMNPDAPAG